MSNVDKAIRLINKFIPHSYHDGSIEQCFDHAKANALIHIDGMIDEMLWVNLLITFDNPIKASMNTKIEELKQIKIEIINLKNHE